MDNKIDLFDKIACVLDTGKSICLGTRFNTGGMSTAEVKLDPNGQFGHAITVTDYTMFKGQKALIFDNSWGYSWGLNGQGIITEDQISGIVTAAYFENLQNNYRDVGTPIKPRFLFTKDLAAGMKNNDVIALQDCLKFEGLFPSVQFSTGYFGGLTRKAVIAFQIKYSIAPAVGYCGILTRTKLNELFI